MKQLAGISILFFAGTAILAANDVLTLRPGKYEETVVTEMKGRRLSAPQVHSKCIHAADLKNPEAIFNERVGVRFATDKTCTTHNLSIGGGKLSYDEDCQNRKVHVEATFSSTEYTAVRQVVAKRGPTAFTYRIKAKRTGECSQ